MPDDNLRLILGEIEAEVLQEALELYLGTRRTPADPRFDYRYRIAHGVLDSLVRRNRVDALLASDAEADTNDASATDVRKSPPQED